MRSRKCKLWASGVLVQSTFPIERISKRTI